MQRKKQSVATVSSGLLKGWPAIAGFLKMPASTAQRWAKAGMPVRREGRFIVAEADELRAWIGREAAMPGPAHIATNTADLAAGLKESIASAKKQKRQRQGVSLFLKESFTRVAGAGSGPGV